MRIAIITNLFPPIQTGSSYWTKELAQALAQNGHEVVVITCAPEIKKIQREKTDNVTIYRLPTIGKIPALKFFLNFEQFYLMKNRSNLLRIKRILKEHKIDLIHQAGQLLDSILITRKLIKELNLPAVCSIHSEIRHPKKIYHFIMRFIDRFFLGNFVLNKFDKIYPLDSYLANYCKQTYKHKQIEILPVCLHSNILSEYPATPGIEVQPVQILSVGHVTEMRTRKELILALAELKKLGIKVKLKIAGKLLTHVSPSLVKELNLSEEVEFLGEVKRENLFNLMRQCQIESHWIETEAIGSAGMEAMALGLPIITYGREDLYGEVPLKNGKNLFFIQPSHLDSIIDTLRTLIENPSIRESVGREARTLVSDYLTWNTVIKKLIHSYQEVLASRNCEIYSNYSAIAKT